MRAFDGSLRLFVNVDEYRARSFFIWLFLLKPKCVIFLKITKIVWAFVDTYRNAELFMDT